MIFRMRDGKLSLNGFGAFILALMVCVPSEAVVLHLIFG